MISTTKLLCLAITWIAFAPIARSSAYETVTILSSRGGEKLLAEVKPAPAGPVKVNITITDPLGNRNSLPVSAVTPEANGRISVPGLPAECRGFLFEIEVIDPSTGKVLGRNWGIIG